MLVIMFATLRELQRVLFTIQPAILAMQPGMARQPEIMKQPAGEDATASDETTTALHCNGGSSEEDATATPAARDDATMALQRW